MSTENKTTEQEMGVLEIVLNEILEEQKQVRKLNTDQVTAINQLAVQISNFNEKLENMTVTSPPVATQPIEDILKKGVADMETIVVSQPKNVVKKTQILLYPEQHADLFYKIIFRSWVPLFAVMLLIDRAHNFAIHQSDINKEIRLKELKNDGFGKAWNYPYSHENNVAKWSMNSVINDSVDQW